MTEEGRGNIYSEMEYCLHIIFLSFAESTRKQGKQ